MKNPFARPYEEQLQARKVRLENAQDDERQVTEHLGAVSDRAFEAPSDQTLQKELAQLRASLERARRETVEAAGSLEAFEKRKAQEILSAKQAQDAVAWKTIRANRAKALEHFTKADRATELMMAEFMAGVKLVNASIAICPATDGTPLDAALTSELRMLGYLKLKIRKVGSGGKTGPQNQHFLSRIIPWHGQNHEIKDIANNMEEALLWLEKESPEAKAERAR